MAHARARVCAYARALFLQHEPDDFFVGFSHAEGGEEADGFNGFFDAVFDDAVAAEEFVAVFVHRQADQARVDGRGDLGGAACLGSVADDAGVDGDGVDDGVRDGVQAAALQIRDARAGAAARADGSAVCREPADSCLKMNGDEVRHGQRPQKFFMRFVVVPRKDDHRHAGGDALVAAARVDDDRHFASVHPGVAPRGRVGTHDVRQIVLVSHEQRFADARAVISPETFFSDRHVVFDLPLQQFPYLFDIHGLRKVHDTFDRQAAPIRVLILLLFGFFAQENFAVPLDLHDVDVVIHDAHVGRVFSCKSSHSDVEDVVAVNVNDFDFRTVEVGLDFRNPVLGHACDDFQLGGRVAHSGTGRCGGFDSAQPARIRDDDALDVFDDVAADFDPHPLRKRTQNLAGFCSCVSDRDRLGASHGGTQFLVQDVDIVCVTCVVLIHYFTFTVFLQRT